MTADTIAATPAAPTTNGLKPSKPLGSDSKPAPTDEQNTHDVTDSSVLHRNLKVVLPIVTHARGSYLYTSSGQRILDGSGGAAVVSVGHGVPEIISAVSSQISTLPYVSSALFAIQPAEELARRMCRDSGMERAVFLSGGSEAVESAIKLARQYHVERGERQRTEFIAREASYHGNTLGDTWRGASSTSRYCRPTSTLSRRATAIATELEEKILALGPERVAAFFAEPVVGAAAGCVPFVPGYLCAMKRVCEKYGVLFCLDEIMCGAGRTGKLHAWMNDLVPSSLPARLGGEGEESEDAEGEGWGEEARPDIQTLGKGLCGGYAPLSAVLVSRKVCEGLEGGSGAFRNGYTFQSSGTGVAAGLAVYEYMEKHDFTMMMPVQLSEWLGAECARRGQYLRRLLEERVSPLPHVGNVRGLGLFQGIEFVADKNTKAPFAPGEHVADKVANAILEHGAAVYHGAATRITGDHIMLCPPYTVSEAEIDELVDAVVKGIQEVFPQ
ncbi:aminotransferase, class III [Trichosporon asahii var. asahii CBS 8904]|uniref:Aminotransferase, class III n=1 Tax=Trichosporon asahii var. asahii (strain CBS 8904) TaxID=1220162 RepID=K1V9D5_TRIAC|nr:aminotransferase, class III [Trichosporon asahii var. asahii CBS 8904]